MNTPPRTPDSTRDDATAERAIELLQKSITDLKSERDTAQAALLAEQKAHGNTKDQCEAHKANATEAHSALTTNAKLRARLEASQKQVQAMKEALELGLTMQREGDIWSVAPSKIKAFLAAARDALAAVKGLEAQ